MNKMLVYLCVLALCSVVCGEEKKEAQAEKGKPDYRSVIVDAWLVKVNADALYKSGVKPLSEKDKENVSVMNLLWCLSEPNSGEVIVSARTRAGSSKEVETTFDNQIYVTDTTTSIVPGRTEPIIHRSHNPYAQTLKFKTYSTIKEDKQIEVWSAFISKFFCNKVESGYPPEQGSINFESSIVVKAQKPIIVSQSQIGEYMLFLVLRAEIVE